MLQEIKARPVNYSRRVVYGPGTMPIYPNYSLEHRPRVSGVYMLSEAGHFYIGQSVDVFARLLSHLSNPACCGFTAPRAILLASIPMRLGWTWNMNHHYRLIAEARFIAAALSLDIPLTNRLTKYKRGKLLSLFPDITTEQKIIEGAVSGN